MGSPDIIKTFHVDTAKKRVKELVKETQAIVPEGTGGELRLSDHRLDDHFSVHVSLAVEWNAVLLTVLDVSFNKFSDGLARGLGGMSVQLPSLHTVNLSNNNFADASSDSLIRFLAKAPALAHVDLSLNHLGKMCAKHLSTALPPVSLKSLVSLNLSSNKLLDDGCDLICHALATRKNAVQTLTLSMNQLTDAASVGLAHMVAVSSIRELAVSGNCIGDHGASAIAFAMDKSATLNTLYLDSNTIGKSGAFTFLNVLRSNPSKTYRVLCLNDNPADAALLAQVAQKRLSQVLLACYPSCPEDGVMDLHGPHLHELVDAYMDDALCNTAVRMLRGFPQLVDVNFSSNAIGDSGALDIGLYLALNPSVTRLNVSGNFIADTGALGLAKGLLVNSSLTELHVGHNRIGDAGVASIYATSFDNKKSVLSTIHVKGNLHSTEGDTTVHAIVQSKALAQRLRGGGTPAVLDLAGMGLRRFGADVLAEHLNGRMDTAAVSMTCEVVNLCRNALGDDGAKSMASLLMSNTTIVKLDLSCNGIGDSGAFALAAMFRVNKTLRAVNLRAAYGASPSTSQVISEAGMLELSAAMQVNTGIQVLDVRDHCANSRVVASWVHMLQHNTGLQKFNGGTPASFLARHDVHHQGN